MSAWWSRVSLPEVEMQPHKGGELRRQVDVNRSEREAKVDDAREPGEGERVRRDATREVQESELINVRGQELRGAGRERGVDGQVPQPRHLGVRHCEYLGRGGYREAKVRKCGAIVADDRVVAHVTRGLNIHAQRRERRYVAEGCTQTRADMELGRVEGLRK